MLNFSFVKLLKLKITLFFGQRFRSVSDWHFIYIVKIQINPVECRFSTSMRFNCVAIVYRKVFYYIPPMEFANLPLKMRTYLIHPCLVLTQFANKFVCSEACQGNAIILRGLARKLVWCQFQQNNQTFWSKSETNDEHFWLWPIVGNIFINFGEEEIGCWPFKHCKSTGCPCLHWLFSDCQFKCWVPPSWISRGLRFWPTCCM